MNDLERFLEQADEVTGKAVYDLSKGKHAQPSINLWPVREYDEPIITLSNISYDFMQIGNQSRLQIEADLFNEKGKFPGKIKKTLVTNLGHLIAHIEQTLDHEDGIDYPPIRNLKVLVGGEMLTYFSPSFDSKHRPFYVQMDKVPNTALFSAEFSSLYQITSETSIGFEAFDASDFKFTDECALTQFYDPHSQLAEDQGGNLTFHALISGQKLNRTDLLTISFPNEISRSAMQKLIDIGESDSFWLNPNSFQLPISYKIQELEPGIPYDITKLRGLQ